MTFRDFSSHVEAGAKHFALTLACNLISDLKVGHGTFSYLIQSQQHTTCPKAPPPPPPPLPLDEHGVSGVHSFHSSVRISIWIKLNATAVRSQSFISILSCQFKQERDLMCSEAKRNTGAERRCYGGESNAVLEMYSQIIFVFLLETNNKQRIPV